MNNFIISYYFTLYFYAFYFMHFYCNLMQKLQVGYITSSWPDTLSKVQRVGLT